MLCHERVRDPKRHRWHRRHTCCWSTCKSPFSTGHRPVSLCLSQQRMIALLLPVMPPVWASHHTSTGLEPPLRSSPASSTVSSLPVLWHAIPTPLPSERCPMCWPAAFICSRTRVLSLQWFHHVLGRLAQPSVLKAGREQCTLDTHRPADEWAKLLGFCARR